MAYTRQQLIDAAYQAEKKYGLPKGMLVAQLHQESSDGTNTYNPEGPVGVMQIQPDTAKSLGVDPNDPMQAIDGAARLQAQNLQKSNGDVGKALELYYAGSEKGIGPRSKAYPGQVGAKWSPADAFDAISDFTAPQPPAQADNGAKFDSISDLSSSDAPAPTAEAAPTPTAPQADPAIAKLEEGMQQVAAQTHDPNEVRKFVVASGYDPSTIKNLDANVQAGRLRFQNFNPNPVQHNTTNDLEAGFSRGAGDVFGTINGLASYMDQRFPALAAIDRAAGTVIPAVKPETTGGLAQSNLLARRAYDQNYDSMASGAGRLTGQVVAGAPFAAAATSVLPALAPEAAAPVVNFALGKGGTNLIGKAASMATAGSVYGASGNALTSSSSDAPLADQIENGAKVGAVLGPVAGAVGGVASKVANRIAPGVDEATAKLAQLAQDKYGFNITGDQITNSPLVRRLSGMMNMNPINNHVARDVEQQVAFSRAVGKTFGADAPDGVLSPEVMQKAKDRLGSTFDAIAARNPIHIDSTNLMDDLGGIESEAQQVLPEGEFAPISRQMDSVISQAAKNNGTLTGEMYQALTRKGSPLDRAANSANPNIRHYAIQVRGALDDALESSASPEDLKALQQARLQYKNMKTVEPLISKDTENMVSPGSLNQRVSVTFKNRAYQGAGDLDELAKIGKRFLTPPSSSGSAENIRALKILEGAGTGGALGLALGGHLLGYGRAGEAAGLGLYLGKRAAGSTASAGLQQLFHSNLYKNKLLNGALNANSAPAINLLPVSRGARRLAPNLLVKQLQQPGGQPSPQR